MKDDIETIIQKLRGYSDQMAHDVYWYLEAESFEETIDSLERALKEVLSNE